MFAATDRVFFSMRYHRRPRKNHGNPAVSGMEDLTEGSRTLERRHGERRTGVGRRILGDLRITDRRTQVIAVAAERRVLPDRRLAARRREIRRRLPDRRVAASSQPEA
jgi:hypothetical protein